MSQKHPHLSQEEQIRTAALDYHRFPKPGKLCIRPTKAMANAQDLSLAYTPGVASPCREIARDPSAASLYTSRGNLVAVISNGTAVLGLGDIGPLASKPVMEGKAVLFKKFAGVDVFDIEINEKDPRTLASIIRSLEPTFGGINLEDIKAPECFEVERILTEEMNIPVFHDDQHGTAIIVAAAVLNGLKIVNKDIRTIRMTVCGAGSAALACLDLLLSFGLQKEHVLVTDQSGVLYEGRGNINPFKEPWLRATEARDLADAVQGADVFLGVSTGKGILTEAMVATMAPNPLILALANPHPEIMPDVVARVRPDAIVATGRSDFPNQVNNVLCFPYIFRGALDAGATHITLEMKKACVEALARLAQTESPASSITYSGPHARFGRDYIIPKPFDPRLLTELAPAVARAAMESGVATRPIEDFESYRQDLLEFVWQSGGLMRPVFAQAQENPRTVVFAGGEESRTLQAVQIAVDDKLLKPVLVGRADVIAQQVERLGLRLKVGTDYQIVDILKALETPRYWEALHHLMKRRGMTPSMAKSTVISNPTALAALMVRQGEADALVSGASHDQGRLGILRDVIGMASGTDTMATMTVLLLPDGVVFVADTSVNLEPDARQLAEITCLAAGQIRKFGLEPRIALLSHSSFGSHDTPATRRIREALEFIRDIAPELNADGEMSAELALDEEARRHILPDSPLKGRANLFVMPGLDAASISSGLLGVLGESVTIGPLVLGLARPAHLLLPSMTPRDILKIAALAVVEAQGTAA